MSHLLHRFISDKSGVTAIEYTLVASMIVLIIIVAEGLLGTRLAAKFTSITGDFLRKLNAGNFHLLGPPLSVFSSRHLSATRRHLLR